MAVSTIPTQVPLPTPPAAPLPAPEVLADVLYRLADPSVPAEQKLGLVQYSTADDVPGIDNFGQALQDGGFAELSVQANGLRWLGAANKVLAIVTIGARNDPARSFTAPMEFTPIREGWQLTRQTADQLLTLGKQVHATPPG